MNEIVLLNSFHRTRVEKVHVMSFFNLAILRKTTSENKTTEIVYLILNSLYIPNNHLEQSQVTCSTPKK